MHRNTITVNDTLRFCICNAFEVEQLVPRKHKPALTTSDGQSAARSEARKALLCTFVQDLRPPLTPPSLCNQPLMSTGPAVATRARGSKLDFNDAPDGPFAKALVCWPVYTADTPDSFTAPHATR